MNLLGGNNKYISELKNPFDKDCVERIDIHIFKRWDSKSMIYNAVIGFKNGNTEGKQRFETDNFAELIKKTEDFIKNL